MLKPHISTEFYHFFYILWFIDHMVQMADVLSNPNGIYTWNIMEKEQQQQSRINIKYPAICATVHNLIMLWLTSYAKNRKCRENEENLNWRQKKIRRRTSLSMQFFVLTCFVNEYVFSQLFKKKILEEINVGHVTTLQKIDASFY